MDSGEDPAVLGNMQFPPLGLLRSNVVHSVIQYPELYYVDGGRELTPFELEQLMHNDKISNPSINYEAEQEAEAAKRRRQLEELKHLPPDVFEAYKLACKEGSRPSHTTRLMLVGHYGAGKTSLKRCLLNKPFITEYNITNGIEVDPSMCRVDIERTSNWKHVEGEANKDDSYTEEFVKVVSHLLQKGDADTKEQTGYQGAESSSTSAPKGSPRKCVVKAGARRKDPKKKYTKREKGAEEASADRSVVLPDDELMSQLQGLNKSEHHEEHEDEFSVWDFAGQSTYYTTHQVFLTHRAIYLAVLNIMEALDSPINTDRLGFKESAQNGISSQAIIDQLDYWMQCISTHTSSRTEHTESAESIIIVLTHKDQLYEKYGENASQKIRDFHRSIMNHIKNKIYFDRVHLQFFTVANNSEDDPEVDRLRETVVELARSQPYWGAEIPLKWIALRDHLREMKSANSYIITFEEAWGLCQEEKVRIDSKTDLYNVLKFYHETGELVFFADNNLKDHIILEPQWLIDAISKVITIPRFYQPSDSPRSAEMWQVLEEHGLLTQSILGAVWSKAVKKHVTHLMFKFRLMLPMRVCNMTEVHQKMIELDVSEDEAFLVPCLLPIWTGPDTIANLLPIPEVLVLFPDGFIPVGVTGHLISGLVMNEAWVLTGKVFQNHATFLPEGHNSNLIITVHQKEDHLNLQGHILDDKPTHPNCLRPYLFVLIEQLGFVVRSSCPKATFELAVRCGCDVPERSIMKIGTTGEGIEGHTSIYCHQHQTNILTESYSPWFDVKCVKRLPRPAGEANLNNQTLLKVARQLGPEWQGLGYHLVESHVVTDLYTPLQGGPGLYGLRMLLRWHQGLDSASIGFMKDQLIQVMEGEGRSDLRQIICEYDGPNEQHLFHKLSRGLTKIWRKVGMKLGVDAGDMDAIETPQIPDYNPGLQMLVTWRNQGGCRSELIRHLKELKHHAIARALDFGEL